MKIDANKEVQTKVPILLFVGMMFGSIISHCVHYNIGIGMLMGGGIGYSIAMIMVIISNKKRGKNHEILFHEIIKVQNENKINRRNAVNQILV